MSNALLLNKQGFHFKESNTPLCSLCKEEGETVFDLYFYCPNVRNLWNQLKYYLAEDLMLPPQTQPAVFDVFEFSDKDNLKNVILYNHFFVFCKLYVYRSREKRIFECYELGESDNENKKKYKKKTHFILKKSAKYNKEWCKTDIKLVVYHFLATLGITETKSCLVKTGRKEGGGGERKTLIYANCLYNFLVFLISISLLAIIYLYHTCITNLILH